MLLLLMMTMMAETLIVAELEFYNEHVVVAVVVVLDLYLKLWMNILGFS